MSDGFFIIATFSLVVILWVCVWGLVAVNECQRRMDEKQFCSHPLWKHSLIHDILKTTKGVNNG